MPKVMNQPIKKVEETDKNIRIPVKGEEGKHTGHRIRTIVVSAAQGIKALYCTQDRKVITYIFAKNKGWTIASAQKWVDDHTKKLKSINEINVDQEEEFLKLIAVMEDGETEDYIPNSDSFILEKDIEEFTTGYKKKENEMEEEKQIGLIKLDKQKQIVYGVFLVPDKADHDGDVISSEDIEKVAHGFLVEYRTIDEMHKQIIKADIIESAIAWKDKLDFYGKELSKGTWFGGIKVHDKEIWDKILTGEYKAFSVRIAGVREPIKEKSEGE